MPGTSAATTLPLLAAVTAVARVAAVQKPNILLFLTDDQDILLGGFPTHGEPMSQARRLIQSQGATASQWRIHTPICGPSRAELQSGRYYHNIASKALTPPSCLGGNADPNGGACLGSGAVGQVDLGNKVWPFLFPTHLRKAGYKTGLFGKCMNGDCGANSFASGHNLHLMGAFDRWFEHAGFVNGTFFDTEAPGCNNTLANADAQRLDPQLEAELWEQDRSTYGGGDRANGCPAATNCCTTTFPGGEWAGRGDGYDTSTIGNVTIEWLKKLKEEEDDTPWFVYFAPHAPHSPSTPAPWYEDKCEGVTSPRNPAFNYSGPHRTTCARWPPSGPPACCLATHVDPTQCYPCPLDSEGSPPAAGPVEWWDGVDFNELTSCQPYFDEADARAIDALARKRCQSLLSVDDSYAGIMSWLASSAELEHTYVLVTSDHGYNLGQHMIPSNKFLLYEHSLRIPMLFFGPGIQPGSETDFLGTQVDLAPTILSMAGVQPPSYMDGMSVLPLLVDAKDGSLPLDTQALLLQSGPIGGIKPHREASFHEYYNQGPWEVGTRHPLDDWSNTYIGLTYKGSLGYWKYGVYDPYGKQTNFTKPYMYELFNLTADGYELRNEYNSTLASKPDLIGALHKLLREFYECEPGQCNQL